MRAYVQSIQFHRLAGIFIGSVWVFHGFYSKILGGIPRHQLIVARILGEKNAEVATIAIGALEVLLGIWVFSGRKRKSCALVQTLAIVAMNSLEIFRADDLLISAIGMVILNAVFLALVWHWARFKPHTLTKPPTLP